MSNAKALVLIVEDEPEIAELIEFHAERAGMRARKVHSGRIALDVIKREKPDLIVLDLMLPDIDGLEVCRRLKQSDDTRMIPIVMVTAKGEEADIVAGIELGADDYVTKPFRLAVLQARIRAQLRSHEHSEGAVFRLGPYEFRPAAKVLVDSSGRKVRLTEKETNILKYLYRAGDKSVAREELLAEVWGYNAGVTTHTLETHVYRLRQKIESDPAGGRLLLTEGGGYRLAP